MKNRYANRDLSLLDFNRRVLDEAADPSTPLLERLNFLAICSNNLDEFYRTRFAGLERVAIEKNGNPTKDLEEELLFEQVNESMAKLQKSIGTLYEEIRAELAGKGIEIVDETKLSDEQQEFVRKFFHDKVRPALMPVFLDKIRDTGFIRDKATYLVARLSGTGKKLEPADILLEVPVAELSRFLVLPQTGKSKTRQVMLLDDVIRFGLPGLLNLTAYTQVEAYSIKINRDAEIEIDDEPGADYLKTVRKSLSKRQSGQFVRLVHDRNMPPDLLQQLVKALKIQDVGILKSGEKYNNFKDFMGFPRSVASETMSFEPLPQLPCKALTPGKRILDIVRERDVLLHYPYQSFDHIIDLLMQASIDRNVKAIKMTIYRAAKNSRIIAALMNAARNGKKVTVYIELRASFDEEANINWAQKMEDEGIKIVYHLPGDLKVHSKLILIRRREKEEMVDYAAIGTGNPNESTSKFYADEHLLTADNRLTADVAKIFKLIASKKKRKAKPFFESLIVSPYETRSTFMQLIDREIEHANAGRPSGMIVKLNNLVDRKIIDKMYEASQNGVEIRCIIRGMSCMVPGVHGQSENITAVRIVDRFLEHARIIWFCNGGNDEIYIGSSDWMGRNFDGRIEVCTPVFDRPLREELKKMLEIQLADNVKARLLDGEPVAGKKSDKKVRSQYDIHEFLRKENQGK